MVGLKVVFAFFTFFVVFSVQEKLKVSLFYESLCPYSKAFVVQQLYPTFVKLNSVMNIDLIPYGNANHELVDGQYKFKCQHGPNECLGNKIQACALKQGYGEEVEITYINCLMADKNPHLVGEKCANQVGVSWERINACVTSELGDKYLAEYGDRTHSTQPKIRFVPTVFFNDKYDDDLQSQATTNLTKLVRALTNYPA